MIVPRIGMRCDFYQALRAADMAREVSPEFPVIFVANFCYFDLFLFLVCVPVRLRDLLTPPRAF